MRLIITAIYALPLKFGFSLRYFEMPQSIIDEFSWSREQSSKFEEYTLLPFGSNMFFFHFSLAPWAGAPSRSLRHRWNIDSRNAAQNRGKVWQLSRNSWRSGDLCCGYIRCRWSSWSWRPRLRQQFQFWAWRSYVSGREWRELSCFGLFFWNYGCLQALL